VSQDETNTLPEWQIFTGKKETSDIARLAKFPPPPWRDFTQAQTNRGTTYQLNEEQIRLVNAALYLRRPLLITGNPGVGKSSLAYAVAEALNLEPVFRWSITTRSTLTEGLYRYDAIGRMQEAQLNPEKAKIIQEYLTLGPLGSALAETKDNRPRVLLIDEIDKSDMDLPNDLLNVFEEGEFDIPELARITNPDEHKIKLFQSQETVAIKKGKVRCNQFPFVVLTSNGERDFPAPFLRRCLRLEINPPSPEELRDIVHAHLAEHFHAHLPDHFKDQRDWQTEMDALIKEFIARRDQKREVLANDQLLNAVYLIVHSQVADKKELIDALLRSLGQADA
jgi:MoxR-like ATPase